MEVGIGNDGFGKALKAGILDTEYLVAEDFIEDADDWHIKCIKKSLHTVFFYVNG